MNNKQFKIKNAILLAAVLGTAPALASAATEVTMSGDIIIRPFHRDNARDFNSSTNDVKNFTTERSRLKANIKVEENIGGVVELLHFRKWGAADPNRVVDANTGLATTVNALDDNWLDLNQAYIEVKNLFDTPLYLKAGRQEMAYGDQRLVGNTNFWSTFPFPRAYDAVKIGTKNETFDIDAWMAKVTERQMGSLMGAPVGTAAAAKPSDRDFRGIWATLKNIPDNTLDLYVLNMADNGYDPAGTGALSTYDGTTLPPNFGHFPYVMNTGATVGDGTNVYNWGARLKGKYSSLDYSLELNKQSGHFVDGANISATGGAAVVGYTIPEAMGLRISTEYVFASGDDTPNAGDHKTFYQFTPSPHNNLGVQDFIAFQNINAWRIGASFKAKENLKLSADFWDFQLDKQQDYWYSSNGTTTRTGSTFASNGADALLAERKIGTEIDLVANYQYSPALSFDVGYSVFNPGNGIKNTTDVADANGNVIAGHTTLGQGDRATFAYGMLMLKF